MGMNHSITTIFLHFLLSIIVFSQGFTADLIDIRTGAHKNFTRVVFQFNKPVHYNITSNLQNKKIFVKFSPVSSLRQFNVNLDEESNILNVAHS
ncbi:MAG: hypothetical protein D6813_03370, partial [Calditrichaeota bacterium]